LVKTCNKQEYLLEPNLDQLGAKFSFFCSL